MSNSIKSSLSNIVLIFLIILNYSHADCAVDVNNQVFCSKELVGGAAINKQGIVMCGGGKCAQNKEGEVVCSAGVGGGVAVDNKGKIYCAVECRLGSRDECELANQY